MTGRCTTSNTHRPLWRQTLWLPFWENAVETPTEESDSELTVSSGDSVVLHGISWKLYRKLRKMPENRNIRMTYDRGELEIMSPSAEHEGIATLLGNLITVWALEQRVPFRSCRTITIRRSLLERGFEPDNCYYVQHEPQMWNRKKINFRTDPPPDLAIEVEVTRKLLNKMELYAAFRVPELWRWSGGAVLVVLELSPEGRYVARETSLCFPAFPIAKAQEILKDLLRCSRGRPYPLLPGVGAGQYAAVLVQCIRIAVSVGVPALAGKCRLKAELQRLVMSEGRGVAYDPGLPHSPAVVRRAATGIALKSRRLRKAAGRRQAVHGRRAAIQRRRPADRQGDGRIDATAIVYRRWAWRPRRSGRCRIEAVVVRRRRAGRDRRGTGAARVVIALPLPPCGNRGRGRDRIGIGGPHRRGSIETGRLIKKGRSGIGAERVGRRVFIGRSMPQPDAARDGSWAAVANNWPSGENCRASTCRCA